MRREGERKRERGDKRPPGVDTFFIPSFLSLSPSFPLSLHPTPVFQELSNPILYLDIMRWCWQQDFRSRPSARQLIEVLTNQSVPRLVDAISLHSTTRVTCSAICGLPIEQSPQEGGGCGPQEMGEYVSLTNGRCVGKVVMYMYMYVQPHPQALPCAQC